MGLYLAFKAFFKALKNPLKAQEFIADSQPEPVNAPDFSHLRLLSSLQSAGRLIDFLKEDLTGFSDAQVGAAVRKIHQDCAATLEELVAIRPLREEAEGTHIQILKGFNPAEIKLVGNIKGEPPFQGIVIHPGWRAHKHSLPKRTGETPAEIICPAEIEIQS